MTYEEFTTKLKVFGYKHSSYVAVEMEFVSWTFTTPNREDDIERVSIGYCLDGEVVRKHHRQQFGNTPDLIKIHKHTKGTAGFWSDYTYEEAINELIDLKLLSIEALRDNKLSQLGI